MWATASFTLGCRSQYISMKTYQIASHQGTTHPVLLAGMKCGHELLYINGFLGKDTLVLTSYACNYLSTDKTLQLNATVTLTLGPWKQKGNT
jgi:hypothetical protein